MRSNKFSAILIMVLAILFLLSAGIVLADDNNNNPPSAAPALLTGEGDAIAVRVVPNPNHYSVYRWYESQGFQGSPQALIVDGYEAVRDGRTVYVNAANILPDSKTIFTNIYLISYNQDPNEKTVDILGQIVSHWKFNSNLILDSTSLPTCSISTLLCSDDSSCQADQYCSDQGLCLWQEEPNCSVDEDCPANFFCNSVKSKIIRDLKRVGKLEELKEALAKYRDVNGRYPLLSAGTYIAGHTVSAWPSWNNAFLSGLAVTQSFIDPINRLGECPDFDQQTCWNEITKRFVYEPTSDYLKLPADSYAFVYSTDDNGSDYNLCAVMESRDLSDPDLGYHFSPNDPAAHQCVTATGITSGGQGENTAPRIISQALVGEANQEYNGFIKAIDDQDNPMTWVLTPVSSSWPDWKNSTANNAPVLLSTNDPNQKKIYAEEAGAPNTYYMQLKISDSQGAVMATVTPIIINNQSPFIEAENANYVLDPAMPLDYSFFYSDNNVSGKAIGSSSSSGNGNASNKTAFSGNNGDGPSSGGNQSSSTNSGYSITKISGPFDILNSSGIAETITSVGINRYKVNFNGLVSTAHKFYRDTDFVYEVKVTDNYNNSSTKKFTLRVIVNDPALNFNCATSVRMNNYYSCRLGPLKQGNYIISYLSNVLPTGLYLEESQGMGSPNGGGSNTDGPAGGGDNYNDESPDRTSNIFLKLANYFDNFLKLFKSDLETEDALAASNTNAPSYMYLLGTPTISSIGYQINIKAINDYGASSTKDFILRINNYCGDDTKQLPNLENRGGIYNDGYEDCDGKDGIALGVADSSIEKQYACATEGDTPYPILTNSYCVFLSPIDGGGFCGDTYCQSIENENNCPADCDPDCRPDCTGKQCGPDGCSGTCGTCRGGDAAIAGVCVNGTCQSGCTPDCAGKNCGPDGCGGSCGVCPHGYDACENGQCIVSCTPDCQGKQCGPDGCGGSCGTCPRGKTCNAAGHCTSSNYCGDGNCTGNEDCNNCISDCGCPPNHYCTTGGVCIGCDPACE